MRKSDTENIQAPSFLLLIVASATFCHSTMATAQQSNFKFELTPFAAYRVGGSFEEKDGSKKKTVTAELN